jgi:uncharacterized protein
MSTVTVSTNTVPLSSTNRSALRRKRERGGTDRSDLYAVLDAGMICHLGVVLDGSPRVLPTAYGRIDDTLYLHGSVANGAFAAADGHEVCVTITLLEGMVCARSVNAHSLNYRSAMIFGVARIVHDEAGRLAGLRAVTENLIPGRWAAAREPNRKEMAAVAVLALPLTEASVKTRTGGPLDDPADYALDVWAGVVPVRTVFGTPEPDPALPPSLPVPGHIVHLLDT